MCKKGKQNSNGKTIELIYQVLRMKRTRSDAYQFLAILSAFDGMFGIQSFQFNAHFFLFAPETTEIIRTPQLANTTKRVARRHSNDTYKTSFKLCWTWSNSFSNNVTKPWAICCAVLFATAPRFTCFGFVDWFSSTYVSLNRFNK